MKANESHDIFFSYSRHDEALARVIVDILKAEGFTVWWDQDIEPDEPWAETIEKRLFGAKLVVVGWSPTAVASEAVREEARWAKNHGTLLQIFLRVCNPPLFFGERQIINMESWFNENNWEPIEKAIKYVRTILSNKSQLTLARESGLIGLFSQIKHARKALGEEWFRIIPIVGHKGIRVASSPTELQEIPVGSRVKLVFDIDRPSRICVLTIDSTGIASLDQYLQKEKALILPSGKSEFFGPPDQPLEVQPPIGLAITVAFLIEGPLKLDIEDVVKNKQVTPARLHQLLELISNSSPESCKVAPVFYSVSKPLK